MDTLMSSKGVVCPQEFVATMETRWTEKLGNKGSSKLRELWAIIAQTFNRSIKDSQSIDSKWRVLNPPTGSGKSQGTAVYCSLLAKHNQANSEKIGVLIVTRLIDDANGMASLINELSGSEVAIANHSDVKLSAEIIKSFDILVVTHASYLKSLEDIEGHKWSNMINWEHGNRKLTVIDETLANIVDQHVVSDNDIRMAHRYFDFKIEEGFPSQVQAVRTLLDVFTKISALSKQHEDNKSARTVWSSVHKKKLDFPKEFKMEALREYMLRLPYDILDGLKSDPLYQQRKANQIDKILRDIEAIYSRWAWYQKSGEYHLLNCSRLIVPRNLPAPVVLDATAKQQILWSLLEDRAEIISTPSGVRSYKNVKLHVTTAKGVGKTSAKEAMPLRLPRILSNLERYQQKPSKVLLITHKSVEHLAMNYKPDLEEYHVAHWGAVDGRNDWRHCNKAVITTLPYRGATYGYNMFFALQGLQDTEWFKNPIWKDILNVRDFIESKQIATDVIQGINRIACRTVIDDEGNCPEVDAYIVLPKNKLGNEVLEAIKDEMPDISISDWDIDLKDETKLDYKIRKGSSHEALITLMKNRDIGETNINLVTKELNLTQHSAKKLKRTLSDSEHTLSKTLAYLGCHYISIGNGKSTKGVILKREIKN